MDEKTGILIDHFFSSNDNELISQFVVNQKAFNDKMVVSGDHMVVETNSYWTSGARRSAMADGSNAVVSLILRDRIRCELTRNEPLREIA